MKAFLARPGKEKKKKTVQEKLMSGSELCLPKNMFANIYSLFIYSIVYYIFTITKQ